MDSDRGIPEHLPVHGIDLSKAMVARLRAKPGAEAIGATIGDFATATVDGSFTLVYLVFNTIMNQTACAFHASETRWGIDEYDVVSQGLISHHFETVEGRLERFSAPYRYAWPAELDLMAALAGMRLRERWGGWKREPFTSESDKHVSVWEEPEV